MMKFLVCCLLVLAASVIEGKSISEKRGQKQCGCVPTKFTAVYEASVTNAKGVPSPFNMNGRVIVDLHDFVARFDAKSSDVPGVSREITILDILLKARTANIIAGGAALKKCMNVYLPSEIKREMDLDMAKTVIQQYKCFIRDSGFIKPITSEDGKKVIYTISTRKGASSMKLTYSADSCDLQSFEISGSKPGGVRGRKMDVHAKLNIQSFDVQKSDFANFCHSRPIRVTMQQLKEYQSMARNMGLA